ncbi:MAG TPA: toll/interleukin-1 receptor domain-containing protein [Ktedonobacterales bacterium]|jgi:hypothetical protein|nr:toll/interleukin-1 receptor domain-containing protein [Ktedonobacterales bacterium]
MFIGVASQYVRADATEQQTLLGRSLHGATREASVSLERGIEITIEPSCRGITLIPERATLRWFEDWQRTDFRFRADLSLAEKAVNGEVVIRVGPLVVAVLEFGILVDQSSDDNLLPIALASDGKQSDTSSEEKLVERIASMYGSIFASYSHADQDIVLACRNAYRALGLSVNIDVDSLRSGEFFDHRIQDLIRESDVFQLFWSARSARSVYVEREWRYALEHDSGEGYIRLVYWETPH